MQGTGSLGPGLGLGLGLGLERGENLLTRWPSEAPFKMIDQDGGCRLSLVRQKLERSLQRLCSEFPWRIMHSRRKSMSTDKLEVSEETVNTHWDQQHMAKVWGAKCIKQGGAKVTQMETT